VQTQACGARMVTAPVTGVVAMQVAKPGKRRRLGRQGTAECASVPGAGNASILEEEKEMRELSSLEIRGVDGGLRSVFWSAVAEVVISSVKGAYNYVTDDGAGGGEAFQNGDPTVVANVYGA